MPTDTTEQQEAPSLSLTGRSSVANPVLDDSNLKAMAAKFREEMGGAKPKVDPAAANPDPSKMAAAAKTEAKPAEPGKTEEKPAETATQPNPQPLPGREPQIKRSDFKALEQARDEFKTRADKLQLERDETAKRLKALEDEYGNLKKVLPSEPTAVQKALEEREALSKERDRLQELVETLNLERSPRFQTWFSSERDKHLRVALKHIPAAQQDAVKDMILNNPSDPKLDEILEPLSNTAKRLVTGAIEGLEKLKLERDEALAKGSEKWKELQSHEQQEATKAEQQRKAKMQQLADAAVARARNLPAFQKVDGDDAHNTRIAEREALVRATVLGQLDEETLLAIPGAAMEYLRLKESVVPAMEKRIAEQEALIKQLQSASPSVGDGHGSTRREDKEEAPGQSFAARVKSLMSTR